MKVYCDGADLDRMAKYADDPHVHGFTTNPALMKKAGITHFKTFAHKVLEIVKYKPVSFEVLSDDFVEMERQAREIASWGQNIQVKIPITNSMGSSSLYLIERLQNDGIEVNITAVMTMHQIDMVRDVQTSGILSIFAGRIADTGRDPTRTIMYAKNHMISPDVAVLWASAREVLNVYQAEQAGADIITLTPDLIAKLSLLGKDLTQYSLETVQMFAQDGEGIKL